MLAASPSPGSLTVEHLRASGPPGSRGVLEAGLSAIRVGEVLSGDEILLIPHLRATEPVQSGIPPSLFAARLSDQLRRIGTEAQLDPIGQNGSARPMRFSNHAAFAAWLLSIWIACPEPRRTVLLRPILKGESVTTWQRRHVLPDGRRLVATVRVLAEAGLMLPWLKRLQPPEVMQALRSIATDYNLPALIAIIDNGVVAPTAKATPEPAPNGYQQNPAKRAPPEKTVSAIVEAIAPFVPALAGEASGLAHETRLLLVATLGLAARPNALRAFQHKQWQELAIRPVAMMAEHSVASTSHAKQRQPGQDNPKSETQISRLSHRDQPGTAQPRPLDDSDNRAEACPQQEDMAAVTEATAPTFLQSAMHTPIAGLVAQKQQTAFSTRYGGLFFLINIFLWMGLYPDFTRPLDKGLAPSPFWLLAHVGRRLFGKGFERDALYRWLTDTGVTGDLPPSWQTNPDWYAGIMAPPPRARRRADWLGCLASFLRFRLTQAAEGCEVAQLKLPADVQIGADKISIRFPLNALPLPLRLAGLDRDPGWLPAEGRAIAFIFV